MKMLSPFITRDHTRRFIIKNSFFLAHKLPGLYIQSFIRQGKKSKAERALYTLCAKLNHIGEPLLLLSQSANSLRTPLELSPVRMGKKIKMVPRLSGEHRQTLRSIFVLASQLRTRKFVGKPFLSKLYREIISSLYVSKDSFRRSQQTTEFITGYLNLRYLNKRWF